MDLGPVNCVAASVVGLMSHTAISSRLLRVAIFEDKIETRTAGSSPCILRYYVLPVTRTQFVRAGALQSVLLGEKTFVAGKWFLHQHPTLLAELANGKWITWRNT